MTELSDQRRQCSEGGGCELEDLGLEKPGKRVKEVARIKMLKRLYSRENSASVNVLNWRAPPPPGYVGLSLGG